MSRRRSLLLVRVDRVEPIAEEPENLDPGRDRTYRPEELRNPDLSHLYIGCAVCQYPGLASQRYGEVCDFVQHRQYGRLPVVDFGSPWGRAVSHPSILEVVRPEQQLSLFGLDIFAAEVD